MKNPNYTPIGETDWKLIPEYMIGGLRRYIEHGIAPGSFLSAVLANDLRGAYEKADIVNQHALFNYVKFLYSYAPAGCWGSEENFKKWCKSGGLTAQGWRAPEGAEITG
jgi:hypothetical protein